MADTKVTALTNIGTVEGGDEFYVVDATDGSSAAVLASVMKTYTNEGISGDVVGTTDTQTFTNKTLNSFTNDVNADDVWLQVRNESGATLTKGTPVYASGYNVAEELIEVAEADATSAATMPCIGLMRADLANATTGAVIRNGSLDGWDTSAWSVGDELYVSETTGALTATPPTGSSQVQQVALVTRANASTGAVVVDLEQTLETGFIATLLDDGSAADARTTLAAVGTGDTDVSSYGWFVDEDDMVSDDATKVPSQQSVKAFVEDSQAYTVETESGTTFTPVLADANTYQRLTNASAVTVTIPPNSTTAFSTGTHISFRSAGAGGATLSPGSGVTLNGNTTVSQDETIVAVKVDTNVWDCTGGTAA